MLWKGRLGETSGDTGQGEEGNGVSVLLKEILGGT